MTTTEQRGGPVQYPGQAPVTKTAAESPIMGLALEAVGSVGIYNLLRATSGLKLPA